MTVTFPGVGNDEGAEAALTAASLGLRHDAVPVGADDVAANLVAIASSMDQPTADGVNSWIVSRAAHDAGLVVALSGVGGDELFGGYPSFHQVPRVAAAASVLRAVPMGLRRATADAMISRHPSLPWSRIAMADEGLGAAYRAVRGLFGVRDLERLGALRWIGEAEAMQLFTPETPPARSSADAVALLEIRNYLRNQLLRDTDVMSMAHSLEVRVPLLDDRVLDVALATPADVRNAPGKHMLQAAAGLHRRGPKQGFTLPFGAWMRGPLRAPVRELVLSDALPLGWLMSQSARRSLWDAFESSRVHWSRPWAVGMLRLWAETHALRW
jgi:asparagine synthase (glutamine-hydrolysing)